MSASSTSKTDTVAQRTVKAYLPSQDDVDRWKAAADEAGLSLSRFIQQTVEQRLQEGDATATEDRVQELEQKLDETQRELEQVEDERDRYRRLLDIQEDELQRLRQSEADKAQGPTGSVNPKLLEILIRHGSIDETSLLAQLDVDPDADEAAAVIDELEFYERAGAVEKTGKYWRWTGGGDP